MSLSSGQKDQGFPYVKTGQSYTAKFSVNIFDFNSSKANDCFPEITEWIKNLPDSLRLLAQGMSIPTICALSIFIYVSKDA